MGFLNEYTAPSLVCKRETMKSNPVVWVYLTAPDPAAADRLAGELVARRLAACVNAWDGLRATYRWKGKLERAAETALLVKTVARRVPAVLDHVRRNHPYECPCALVFPAAGGLPAYLRWVRAETAEPRKPRRPRRRAVQRGG